MPRVPPLAHPRDPARCIPRRDDPARRVGDSPCQLLPELSSAMLLSIVLRRPSGDAPGDDTAFDRSVISESLRESLVERAALMRRACFSSSSPHAREVELRPAADVHLLHDAVAVGHLMVLLLDLLAARRAREFFALRLRRRERLLPPLRLHLLEEGCV